MSLVRPADALVVAVAALLVGASWSALRTDRGPAEVAQVSAPGEPDRQLALAQDTTLAVRGRLGHSELEVRGGRVRFTDSPCAGRLCVHAGWLSRSGQVAACLPNGVVVEVRGGDRGFDAITY